MLEKEIEVLKQIEELYHGDVTEQEMLEFANNNKTKVKAWHDAFCNYPLYEIKNAINYYYVHKSSRTRPNITQLLAILSENGAKQEQPCTQQEYLPDLDVRYMHEDVKNGNCHHNLYYYTKALNKIRNNDYPHLRDVENPTKAEILEIVEELCEKATGKKIEFLSKNDLISLGYDMNGKYSIDELTKMMFKKLN